uniref:JmjC domain-containing protein n=1 Tax=Macrostomum lignano TaxID=282301 RepID=A0A1I8H220_9PLAT
MSFSTRLSKLNIAPVFIATPDELDDLAGYVTEIVKQKLSALDTGCLICKLCPPEQKSVASSNFENSEVEPDFSGCLLPFCLDIDLFKFCPTRQKIGGNDLPGLAAECHLAEFVARNEATECGQFSMTPAAVEAEFWSRFESASSSSTVEYGKQLPLVEEDGWELANSLSDCSGVINIASTESPNDWWRCQIGSRFLSSTGNGAGVWQCDWSGSVSYLHWGEARIWYCLASNDNGNLGWRLEQRPGEFVVLMPGARYAWLDCGVNFLELARFCPFNWLPEALTAGMPQEVRRRAVLEAAEAVVEESLATVEVNNASRQQQQTRLLLSADLAELLLNEIEVRD